MSPFDRFEFLQRASGSSAATAPTKPSSQPIHEQAGPSWQEPAGWSDDPSSSEALSPRDSTSALSPFDEAGLSFDAWTPQAAYATQPSIASPAPPVHVAEPQQPEPSSQTYEPDWLSEWESAVPEDETPAMAPSQGWGEPADAAANDSFTWNEPAATIDALDWNEPSRQPWTQQTTIEASAPLTSSGSFDPWRAEVGIPEQAGVVESFGNGSVGEVPYNDERLEVLFNQLDFGPPSADLLSPHSTDSIAAAENHQGSPLRVEEARAGDQQLPPPVRPWEGWIR